LIVNVLSRRDTQMEVMSWYLVLQVCDLGGKAGRRDTGVTCTHVSWGLMSSFKQKENSLMEARVRAVSS
jgi:hypothetical protein